MIHRTTHIVRLNVIRDVPLYTHLSIEASLKQWSSTRHFSLSKVQLKRKSDKTGDQLSLQSEHVNFGSNLLIKAGDNSEIQPLTPDELSNALKNRLRLGRLDIENVKHDEVDISHHKKQPSKYKIEGNIVPKDAIDYLNKKRQVKLKITRKWFNADLSPIDQVAPVNKEELPQLAHDLERVLNKEGIQYLHKGVTNPKTNFHKSLLKIDHLNDFDTLKKEFTTKFVSPSKDSSLLKLGEETASRYYSSTSSMTSTLFQFYMLLNDYDVESPNSSRFKFGTFTRLMRSLPSVFIVSEKSNDVHSVETDKSCDFDTFLSKFGHIAEIILTNEADDVEMFKKIYNEQKLQQDTEESVPFMYDQLLKFEKFKNPENIYNISVYDKFLMRSQLDCYSPQLTGNGTFDLKSRAIADIRFDTSNANMANTDYLFKFNYKDEMDDLIRTGALLKYSFQARIGQMNGIFLAFHNIKQFLGFEYLPLEKIDKVFYSQSEDLTYLADHNFKFSIKIWRQLLDMIKDDLESKNFRVIVKLERKSDTPFIVLKVSAVPMTDADLAHLNTISSNFKNDINELNDKFIDKRVDESTYFRNRQEIVDDYKVILDDFNDSFSEKVMTYTVETRQFKNSEKMNLYEFPRVDDKWTLQCQIVREEQNIPMYINHLRSQTRDLNVKIPRSRSNIKKEKDMDQQKSKKLYGSDEINPENNNASSGDVSTTLKLNREFISNIKKSIKPTSKTKHGKRTTRNSNL